MKKLKLGDFSLWAFRLDCLCTVLLCALVCISGVLIRIGDTPLQHYILTRQLLHQVPVVFFSGLIAAVLCEVIERLTQRDT